MTYSPIIPTDYQTDRQDLNDALAAIVDAFIASESYKVGRMFVSEMPDSFTAEGPLIVLGDIDEQVSFTDQSWATLFSGKIIYIDWMTDRVEYNARVNVWADKMRQLLAVNRSTVNPAAILQQTGFNDGIETRQGSIIVGAPEIAFTYHVRRGDPATDL
jgi:hypothetical protein